MLQALGDSRHPLIFVGIACMVNIGLDLLLVGVWKMGAPGAAYATVFSQFISVAFAVAFLKRNDFPFDFRLRSFRLYRDKVSKMFRVGLPYAIQRTVVALSFLFISALSNEYGTLAAAGAGIVSKVHNVASLPFAALNLAMAAMCGQNLGGGKAERARSVLFTGMKLMFGIGALMFVVVQGFPAAILRIFSATPELIETATPFLRWFSVCYVFFPFSYAINALMTGSGQTIGHHDHRAVVRFGAQGAAGVLVFQGAGRRIPGRRDGRVRLRAGRGDRGVWVLPFRDMEASAAQTRGLKRSASSDVGDEKRTTARG